MPTSEELTRPIIGIENRTAQEAFDIMCDRIRSHLAHPAPTAADPIENEFFYDPRTGRVTGETEADTGGLVERLNYLTGLSCPHDGGFDRELGPIGCALEADGKSGCFCAGMVPPMCEAAAALSRLQALLADAEYVYSLATDRAKAAEQREAAAREQAVRGFVQGVLHGDDEHRDWLLAAGEAFIAGKPLPPPNGKGRSEAAEAKLAAAREQIAELTDRVDELEQDANRVSTEFEKECWIAMRRLLTHCGYDWSGDSTDGVQADDAELFIRDCIEAVSADANNLRASLSSAQETISRLKPLLMEARNGMDEHFASTDEGIDLNCRIDAALTLAKEMLDG